MENSGDNSSAIHKFINYVKTKPIRFDDGPMTTETWTLDLRYGSVPVSKNFIENMMGKRKVVLRANILNQQTTYIYNISGFEDHYQKYIATCPSSNQ